MSQYSLTQKASDALRSRDTMIIFTYALAGLGHLRVTDALYHGLPIGIRPLALGSHDKSLVGLHRLTSIHPVGRKLFEWASTGVGEHLFARVYRWRLRSTTDELYNQLRTIAQQRYIKPKTIVVIATHFSLAHQLAEVKNRVAEETGSAIKLVVQVTDDSPHAIWYVEGADTIVVPSYQTRRALKKDAHKHGLSRVPIHVNPYPVSPYLATLCSPHRTMDRTRQLDPTSTSRIEVAIPISGAAVGLRFYKTFMQTLHASNDRYAFHVVSKKAPFTRSFLRSIRRRSYVTVNAYDTDKRVVETYEALYKARTLSLEVTKPSEQAFKALITPEHNGGSILLFTHPVGTQEHDNVSFLRRHRLIPSESETARLHEVCRRGESLTTPTNRELIAHAMSYRGIRIPDNPKQAAQFVHWCHENGYFSAMVSCKRPRPRTNDEKDELGMDGVERFWEFVARDMIA